MNIESDLKKRDGHIVNNWYIACLSQELKNEPIQRIVYDTPYVLFRTHDGVSCTFDRCLHRASLLSLGKIQNNCLVCPYHGWHYDKDAKVVKIPSEDPQFLQLKNIHQKKIPCFEQDGVVWIWLGDFEPESDPTWRFPYAQETDWTHYFMLTDFPNEVTNLAENFMDVPHTVYVHRGWFRDEVDTRVKIPMTVESKKGRVLVTYHQKDDELSWVAKKILNPQGKSMAHTDEFIYPNITRVDYNFGSESTFIINSCCTPVSSMKTRVYTYIAYKIPFAGKLLKPLIRFYTRQVIQQDVEIMQIQKSSLDFDSNVSYRSTDVDEVHIAIERLRHYGKIGRAHV